jgi:NAD(P)-dependent dehydrogenase (short-subunit alcohol dehydrogenase family)
MSGRGWLEGAVALVTGGGSGIGRAVVDAYRAEGARVGVLELSPEKCAGLRALGEDVVVVEGDATAASANREAVAATVERFGRLDALATFVGIFDLYTPLAELPDERFDAAFAETFDVNVKSVLLAARAALPHLRAARGSIVVTLSSSSFYAGRGGPLYVASKFALRGVVRQLAHELAPEVRVNGVAPGGTIGTDLRGLRSLGQFETILDARPGREERLRSRTPLRVALEPPDHAGAYVLLASDRARGITGEVLRSDGGLGVR